jgi:hypothetical protein
LDVIVLDTPSREAIEISSSLCDLSVFSSKAGSQHGEGAEVAPGGGGSSSASMGKLWPDLDQLDEITHEGTSGRGYHRCVFPEWGSVPSVVGTHSCVTPMTTGGSDE